MKTLYLDMDGVLCSFEKRYKELFNTTGERSQKDFNKNWPAFIQGKNFESLEKFPGCDKLIEFAKDLQDNHGIKVEILSSSGGEKFHDDVTAQKIKWLCDNGITFKANIVPGSGKKAALATPDSVLVDDTDYVIDAFIKANGIGILHTDADETIKKLESML